MVKDTKDTAFVFFALAVGMAAGTGNYLLGVIGTGTVSMLAFVLHSTNFGALYKSEFIIRFRVDKSSESTAHLEQLNLAAKRSSLLHIEPAGDGGTIQLTYDVVLNEGRSAPELARTMGDMPGISEVVIIASKSDVDYWIDARRGQADGCCTCGGGCSILLPASFHEPFARSSASTAIPLTRVLHRRAPPAADPPRYRAGPSTSSREPLRRS